MTVWSKYFPVKVVVFNRCIWLWTEDKRDIVLKEKLMSSKTASKLWKRLDEVAIGSFQLDPLQKLGGPGLSVDVDESLFIKRKVKILYNTTTHNITSVSNILSA